MKLYLIRHGQSKANVDDSVYLQTKDHNIELTDIGRSQAISAGKNLSKELQGASKVHVFVSPYTRTRQTWEGVKSSLCPVTLLEKESPLIREQEYKIFSDIAEMKKKKESRSAFGPFWYRYKNAEAAVDVHQRVMTFWNYLTNQYLLGHIKEKEPVVIVSHEVVVRMFLMILKDLNYENTKVDIGNCDIQVCELEKMKMKSHSCLKIQS